VLFRSAHHRELVQAIADPQVDMVAFERDKVKGAIRTNFILSAEIIVISLGTVATAAFPQQLGVLVGISVIMTVGVYGLVAGIVKIDDAGLHLSRREGAAKALGLALLAFAPKLMKLLSVLGTAAMFLVGGGILVHGLPVLHHLQEGWVSTSGGFVAATVPMLFSGAVGVAAGALVLALSKLIQHLRADAPPKVS
jgi:predicted DNA repair protein MutK